MLYTIFEAFSYIFDISLLIFYMNIFLKDCKKNIPQPIYFLSFAATEIFLYFTTTAYSGNSIYIRTTINISLGIATTLLLTCLYSTHILNRLFIAISFQVICSTIEIVIGIFFTYFVNNEDKFIYLPQLEPYILLVSKIVSLVIIIAIDIMWHRKNKKHSLTYNLLILITPVISLIITVSTPYYLYPVDTILITYIGLIVLNILNYHLLDNVLQVAHLNEVKIQLEQQVAFQAEKYQQISSAYRDTRSLMHDTKKHFFYIQECIENKQYENILDYLKKSLEIIEHTYSRVNTGNLVIHAFISNYMNIAKHESISFVTNIKVRAERVPVKDYDLCVIIGNLMDNSLKAARAVPSPFPRKIEVEMFTDEDHFIMHIKNTRKTDTSSEKQPQYNNLYHGYGLTNVKILTEKYKGNYTCLPNDNIFETIIVFPILDDFDSF